MDSDQKYDIFISYRRATGANAARMMQLALTARGYSAFFDYSSLKDGKFNEAIYSAIDSCEVFILMMTEGALDRCTEEGDWVRLEIQRAIEKGKHIVPIWPSDQAWTDFPANLPNELSVICKEQVSKLDMETLFESSLDEIENYRFSKELRARRRLPGALKAGDDYLSSVTHAGEVFVGRDRELNALVKMLSEHKVPVVTGAGGIGKSELIRQYAVRCRNAYPGGRFQIDMGTARTWNDVFEKLLAGRLGNGQFVRDLLDGRRDEEKSMPLDVGQALLRRARRSGAVLLFLDNVESVGAFVGRDGRLTAFTTDFADGVRLDIVMTTRTSDVTLRPTGRVVELPLGDLSPAAAQELLLKDWPEAGADERTAAGRVAELLGYRALHLQCVPALIGDVNASVICDSFADLERSLKGDFSKTVKAGMEKDYWPEVLWNKTCERLFVLKPLGPSCVKLAQMASCFSPDGFSQHILRHLWKTFAPPEYEDNFDRALNILQRHGVFQSFEPVRIHRLHREVILQTAKDMAGLEDALGSALAAYGRLSRKDWVPLYEHECIRSHLPATLVRDGAFWSLLLCRQPQFSASCPWENLTGSNWRDLLIERPQFADRCSWELLDGGCWSELLRVQPHLAAHCQWEKFGEHEWSVLLARQSQFADRCPWEKLSHLGWSILIFARPQYADICPLYKLSGRAWGRLLGARPEFSDRCPWEMLVSDDLSGLLGEQPQFADRCPRGELDGFGWSRLLCEQPQFADRCPWEKLCDDDWIELLCEQPQFADRCPWELLDGDDWCWLLREQPSFADRCPWELLDGDDWGELLCERPQFANRCLWELLDGNNWSELLREQPQFANLCPWEKLGGDDWSGLLREQPQFADRCPWELLDGGCWSGLLRKQPQFADRCPWELLDGDDWCWLLRELPQFADRCPWELLDGGCWSGLLREQPQFADRCPWGMLDGKAWRVLLEKRPQFADHCSWEKLVGADWRAVLMAQPQLADRCACEKLSGEDWHWILWEQPQLSSYCLWEKLDGLDWFFLLAWQPQFAGRCRWEKFDGQAWAGLLRVQPQFADRCAWEKLDGNNWSWLLRRQPQFANCCRWECLDDKNWNELLECQPQFAKWRKNKSAENHSDNGWSSMKDIRIFVASSCEMVAERNALAYFAIAHEDEFAGRGLRVRLSKWEYVDPTMAAGLKEDEYLKELRDSDGALVLFQKVLGKFTRQEYDEALEYEKSGCRLQAHQILFKEGPGIVPSPELAAWRAELPADASRCFSDMAGLEAEFLALVNRLAGMKLCDAPSDAHVQRVTAFLVADGELAADRDAFADAILNFNDILAYRNLRVKMQFCSPGLDTAECHQIAAASEMMLVLYGRKIGVFGRDEIQRVYKRTCENANPKRLYVFFRTEDEKELPPEFRAFRDSFVEDLGHFVCQYGVSDTLRLNFVMSLERYVGEQCEQQKKEIFSTVEMPTATKFVGREAELVRLHQLLKILPEFPTGRLPVVLGPGGSGKSELIRAYASQFRFKYPGGVFQVDMEKVSDWDGAFRGLLDRASNNGVRVADYLGLGKNDARGEEGRGSCTYSAAQIREALLKTARQKGPVLVVLDNVEDCRTLLGDDGRFCKAFPVGVSERVQVNVVATARVCDVPQNGEGWAVELPLKDLLQEAARELILSVYVAEGIEEIAAVDEIAKLLEYRALFLRRVASLIKDRFSDKDTYVELRDALKARLLDTVSEGLKSLGEDDESRLPSVLWKYYCDRLEKMPLGPACIKLAQVASFFSPDGFPLHILKHLWKTIVAPKAEKKFELALDILRRHNIFQSTDPVRIHRLDRAAILQMAKDVSGLEEELGSALADYGLITKGEWLSLCEYDGIRCHLPVSLLRDGEFWAKLLAASPQFEGWCVWDSLGKKDWCRLLVVQPRFSKFCTFKTFNGNDWGSLLCVQPQFAELCPWERLSGDAWSQLLRVQPQFMEICPLTKLSADNWSWILSAQPRFADLCPWGKLHGEDWSILLSSQPQFAKFCPWEKLNDEDWGCLLGSQPQFAHHCSWEKLEGRGWSELLRAQPQFAIQCPWEKLNGEDWCMLLYFQPQFANRCPREKLLGVDGFTWSCLLCKQPQLADRCPWESLDEGYEWAVLLCDQPQFADRCPWDILTGSDWSILLGKRPQFIDRCQWENLKGSDWCSLLGDQPQFADRCPWNKLDGRDWFKLLCSQPQFADRCSWAMLRELSGLEWCRLLCARPQFASHCPWHALGGREWVELLEAQPQFEDRCPWGKIDVRGWINLLCDRPQFAEHCPWDKLNGKDWTKLLGARPEFEDHCSWEKLDCRDWVELLSIQPQFSDRCSWEKLNEFGWATLLGAQLQFENRCPWEILDGTAWSKILQVHPQLANRCPWELLNSFDWCLLLCEQPQFASRCPWEEFDCADWTWLLCEQPQFADSCPWEKLRDSDWDEILECQPQLEKWRKATLKNNYYTYPPKQSGTTFPCYNMAHGHWQET